MLEAVKEIQEALYIIMKFTIYNEVRPLPGALCSQVSLIRLGDPVIWDIQSFWKSSLIVGNLP